ncbi:MAG: hypothetical protein HZB39_09820 [Planctomycetes bacterium]|nr:hypothetical protein [Planctomycetota bacterium]
MRRAPIAAAAAWFAFVGCGEDAAPSAPPSGPPIATAPETRSEEQIVDAILTRSHGPRRGTFDRAIVELREQTDGPATTVSFALPDRARIVTADGHWTSSVSGVVTSDGPVSDAESARVAILLRALDAITLQPLERRAVVTRVDDDELTITTRDGASWSLEYDRALDAARSLRGSSIAVRFLEHHDSGRTRVPIAVDVEGLGVRRLSFVDTGVEFDARVFAAPGSAAGGARTIVVGGPSRVARPRLTTLDDVRWLMMPDPGDWPGRMELFRTAGARLAPLGYGNGGDPMLVRDDDGTWFVVPFVALVAKPGAIEAKAGEREVAVPRHDAILADAAPGDWQARIAAATAAAEAFAVEHRRRASGPVRITMNLLSADPAAEPLNVDSLPLRVVLPVAKAD